MTPHQKRTLSPITLRMAGDMRVRNLAQRTIDTYTYHVERFAKHWVVQHIPFGKRPRRLPSVLGSEEVSRLIACVPLLKHRVVLLTPGTDR